ncbi:hypothetical protein [Shewanella halifaxensis]|nr:hypothetical protein [Shewanella halifaxensis]
MLSLFLGVVPANKSPRLVYSNAMVLGLTPWLADVEIAAKTRCQSTSS